MKKWTIEDSKEIYNIKGWGVNFFGVNEKGHVYVTPKKNNVQVDLKEVVDELAAAHISAPLLLRFPDILDTRIQSTAACCTTSDLRQVLSLSFMPFLHSTWILTLS